MAEGGPSRKRSSAPGVTLEVEVVRHGEAWAPAHIADTVLRRAAQAAIRAVPPPPGAYQVTLVLTDDAEMRGLNRSFRGKDAPTNVLSFPAEEAMSEPGFLGDVVIAYETTRKEASEQSITLHDHLSHLVVHGLLHLLGFNHEGDAEAEMMENAERTVLASLGIADPYAEDEAARRAEVSS